VSRNYIDFISAYCDSWCDRCAFTDRCSQFAMRSAIAMCDGDVEAAIELAVGPPRVPGRERQKTLGERMAERLADYEPSEKELEEIGREIDQRRQRIERHGLAKASLDYAVAARRWLEKHMRYDTMTAPSVHDAVEVIGWDLHLIHVKIMRALNGRDEYLEDAVHDEGPVQNDWNGSAKVALISIVRSERAWRVIAAETQDEAAVVLAGSLATLRDEMDKEFPRAAAFRRPGFDEPSR